MIARLARRRGRRWRSQASSRRRSSSWLMAMSLAVEKPSVQHASKLRKRTVLGDPTGSTEAKIWLLAVLPSLALGSLASRHPAPRTGVVVTGAGRNRAAHGAHPPARHLGNGHTARFPLGIDLIHPVRPGTSTCAASGRPRRNVRPSSLGPHHVLARRGHRVVLLLEFRRRRGLLRPVPPPPPLTSMGGVPPST